MRAESYVIGVDFGTDSVRSVLVNTNNGIEVATSVFDYPRWKKKLYCDAASSIFRQHPLDYIEGLEYTIKDCVQQVGANVSQRVVGISVDTTGSTPVAVNDQGVPLSLLPEYSESPNAMFVLWKDHSAVAEAAEINAHAKRFGNNYLKYVGGIYSSEWFWAKLLHVFRQDAHVRKATCSWVEHCDWIPFVLSGGNKVSKIKRSVCAAGHKALWADEFAGYPPNEFFATIDPLLDGFVTKLPIETFDASQVAGTLSSSWAKKLGLNTNVVIGVGAFDCHMGAVGGQIKPYHLSKVIGTSTCDILVAPYADMNGRLVKGICGQVESSVIPGMVGLEAGQSAFGDAYSWFRSLLSWPLEVILEKVTDLSFASAENIRNYIESNMLSQLAGHAETLSVTSRDEIAIDWLNGRRTPDADQSLKGAFFGLHLGTNAPQLFRALVESTAFGAKSIVDRFNKQGIPIKGLIALGGIPRKSPFIMQVLADVIGIPIKVHKSEQTCALGAAMFAATAAGVFQRVEDAMEVMGQGFDMEYTPNPRQTAIYADRYAEYLVKGGFIETQTNKNQSHE